LRGTRKPASVATIACQRKESNTSITEPKRIEAELSDVAARILSLLDRIAWGNVWLFNDAGVHDPEREIPQ
jgi:hypothetical protein